MLTVTTILIKNIDIKPAAFNSYIFGYERIEDLGFILKHTSFFQLFYCFLLDCFFLYNSEEVYYQEFVKF